MIKKIIKKIKDYFEHKRDMKDVTRILKVVSPEYMRKLIQIADLTEEEEKVMIEYLCKDNYCDNVCNTLGFGRTTFNTRKNTAILKIKIALNTLLDEKIAQKRK